MEAQRKIAKFQGLMTVLVIGYLWTLDSELSQAGESGGEELIYCFPGASFEFNKVIAHTALHSSS